MVFLRILLIFVTLCLSPLALVHAQAQGADWTFMVYLNGDNNLDSFGAEDMQEMLRAGSSERVNVIVLRDTRSSAVSSKIFYMSREQGAVTVKDFGRNIDMGDWRTLVDFFAFVRQNYPARHYFLDIWNHGTGWNLVDDSVNKGISYDDTSGNHITTPQLGRALAEMGAQNGGHKLDVLGMDACLMQMAEVAYELKDRVDYIAASEETEPGRGWPYEPILSGLLGNSTMSALDLATLVEKEFHKSYQGGSQGYKSVTGSVVDTRHMDALLAAQERFSKELLSVLDAEQTTRPTQLRQVFESARQSAQAFKDAENKDYLDFLKIFAAGVRTNQILSSETALLKAIELLEQAVARSVVANFNTAPKHARANGLALWVPSAEQYRMHKRHYHALAWSQDSLWDEFMLRFHFGTQATVEFVNAAFESDGRAAHFQAQLRGKGPHWIKGGYIELVAPQELGLPNQRLEVPAFDDGIDGDGINHDADSDDDGPDYGEAKLDFLIPAQTQAGNYVYQVRFLAPGLQPVETQAILQVEGEYKSEPLSVESPHPYPDKLDQRWTLSKPGALGIKLHFSKFDTEQKFDVITVFDGRGNEIAKYHGSLEPFWTVRIPGDTAVIRFKSDFKENRFGFVVDAMAWY